MGEDPAYSRSVSLHLSRTLDEIGINKITVKRRRLSNLYCEKAFTIGNRLRGKEVSAFHFGSQTEGATTSGLNSDCDTLICNDTWNVIEDWSEWKKGKLNMLMLHENTAPVYCRLQVLRPDVPMAMEDLVTEHDTYDDRGRVLLKNTCLHTPVPGFPSTRNGPARTGRSIPGFMDQDFVAAMHCSAWPAQAEEFT